MDSYLLLVTLISLSAAFAYINHRFIKIPFVIGSFFLSTNLSFVVNRHIPEKVATGGYLLFPLNNKNKFKSQPGYRFGVMESKI